MKVSIITPAFNAEKWIYETYLSIKNQTYSNWEWLVTDDCSTDNTLSILNELSQQDSRIKVFRNVENSGAAASRNLSIENASGEFLAFLDSDDVWMPTKIEKQLDFMSSGIDFSFTAYELIDEHKDQLLKTVDSTQKGTFSYRDMLRKKATMGCSTVIIRRSGFDDITMPLIRTGQDYALWLKLLRTGKDAHILSDILTQYRILPDSISRNKIKKAKLQWEIYRRIEKLNLMDSMVCFYFYAYRAIFRKR